ncbi:acyltransferase [Mycolicibacterium sp. NCC-Tsukiji]|uniref:acyltransferase family protein n=1 Tax=Mycolicibacterium sp. NCC-Tsukiji TaxID=2185272 RepID=UPI000ED6652E|nr:acyltransferase [Mycolicibacterium sp. NCC-Tsukiji]GCB01218.1 acyltransferase [Mycolicibacterium sp. NCC-Tsukiji]
MPAFAGLSTWGAMAVVTIHEPTKVTRPPIIESLVGIRGFAAAWVLIEHFRFAIYGLFPGVMPLDWWIAGGSLGIEIFFPLSGFIISYMYAERLRTGGSYADYLLKRFARIYPVYITTFLAMAALVSAAAVAKVQLNSATNYTPFTFFGNLLLLQAAPGIPAWNPPAWSVSAEALAYVTFPLTAGLLARLTRVRSALFATTAWLVVGTAAMVANHFVNPLMTSPTMALLRIATEFVAGAMLWKAWSLAGEPRSLGWDALAFSIVVLIVVGLWLLPHRSSLMLLLAPMAALLVVTCASARGPVAWLLSTRPVVFGGKISYSLYMVHFVVFAAVSKAFRWDAYAGDSLVTRLGLLGFYLVTCFVLAIAAYYLVEEPARRAIARFVERRRLKRATRLLPEAATIGRDL